MPFQKFENRNTKNEERITITKSYSIGFPTKFYQDNKLGHFKYTVLYWNEDTREIGIQFTNDEKERKNAFTVGRNKSRGDYGGGISAKSFFQRYKIDVAIYAQKYEWKKELHAGLGELYVIHLPLK